MMLKWVNTPTNDSLTGLQPAGGTLIAPIRKNYLVLIALYVLVMVWIWSGVYAASGTRLLYLIPIQFASFTAISILCYFLIRLLPPTWMTIQIGSSREIMVNSLIATSMVLVLVHWYVLGDIPIVSAFQTNDYFVAGMIRQHITNVAPLANYIPAFLIKSIFPVLLILLTRERRDRMSLFIALVGVIYAVSLMQKSYPLFVLVPPALYCLAKKRVVRGILFLFLSIIAIMIAWLAANPGIRPQVAVPSVVTYLERAVSGNRFTEQSVTPRGQQQAKEAAPDLSEIASISYFGLSTRIAVLPGEVVAKWLTAIPRYMPFEHGCGYRFVAPLLNCAFVDNASALYKHYYPDLYARGYRGSMNAAHFAEEYANFGPIGLLLSGFLLAVVLMAAAVACARVGLVATIALNFPFVAAIGSTALHTTLLSGGWASMMVWTFLLFTPISDSCRAMEYQPATT